MPAPLSAYDGIDRRKLIAAIIRKARDTGKRVPSKAAIAKVLGVAEGTVRYHMQRMKR